MRVRDLTAAALLAAALGGCSASTSSFNDGSSVGGAVVGSLAVPAPAAPASPVAYGAFLEGPIGTRLGDADRDKALQAEIDALASGERKTWRGAKGNYGFVAPASATTPEGCRDFSHTVYIAGRPQVGRGSGCKAPDGNWRITG